MQVTDYGKQRVTELWDSLADIARIQLQNPDVTAEDLSHSLKLYIGTLITAPGPAHLLADDFHDIHRFVAENNALLEPMVSQIIQTGAEMVASERPKQKTR